MPDDPTNGGRFLIQSKATGKQLGLPGSDEGGVYTESHIVPRDQGVAWEVERVPLGYRFTTSSVFPWSTGTGPDEGIGRLDSNDERQVYAHQPNDGAYQQWRLFPDGEGYWQLINVATGYALDGTTEDIYTMASNDGAYQRWGFFVAPAPPF